jgi:hypothetical protein
LQLQPFKLDHEFLDSQDGCDCKHEEFESCG